MKLNLKSLANIAISAAQSAGRVIQQHMQDEILIEKKNAGSSYASQVVTAVDRKCEAAILAHLLPTCETFDIALLSEEREDDKSRLDKDYFWCVDPMDGTLAFINKHPGFSVSIALVAKDGTPLIGVVYDPSTNNLYHAYQGNGAFKNNSSWELSQGNSHFTYVTDRQLKDTLRQAEIKQFLEEKVKELGLKGIREIAGGGAVLNAILVLEHAPACMLKYPKEEKGGGSLWDFAATACIYRELQKPATNFDGGRLDLNRRADTFMNEEGVFYGNFGK